MGDITITLCSSASFFDRLLPIKRDLEIRGYNIFITSMRDYHNLKEDALAKIHYNLIKEHFVKIEKSDAIYVANFEKKGIKGYIGGNTFLEIGKAFDMGIPIYFLNDIPDMDYKEEIKAMQPILIEKNWERLNRFLKEEYKF